jgi:demethylmenaquinone methyltransferase/2-methoxy-6-polyprenyl-1,4-benzoquinol methylase
MYELSEKNRKISEMFSSIAPTYDILNHYLSFNIDKLWRKKAVSLLSGDSVLDVATGTCDVAIEASKKISNVVGVDLSFGMLEVGKKKIEGKSIELVCAPAENLPFRDESFDNVIIAFGIRNVPDRVGALYEFKRVLKKEGRLVILEFNRPISKGFGALYNIYSNNILPFFGKVISGHYSAYSYLPSSIKHFPDVEFLRLMMDRVGFRNVEYMPLTFGVSFIHTGIK